MAGQNGIQTSVGVQQAPGVAGDFASTNPRATVDAGPGGLVAGPAGVTVGRFAWATQNPADGDGAPALVSNNGGSGAPTGFVARSQQGLITTYLADASMVIAPGFQMEMFMAGDFWVKNDGDTQALPGQKAYANFADGKVSFAATGSPASGGSVTGTIAAGSASVTASITDNILTVSAVGSGVVYAGSTASGTGVASGTKIVGQVLPLISGESLGGVGRYYVDIPEQSVASTAVTLDYGLFTAVSGLTGSFGVGQVLAGTGGGGVTDGTTITQLGTGAGGLGTYIVDVSQTVTSSTITSSSNVETKWYCRSSALPGELAKMSSYPQG